MRLYYDRSRRKIEWEYIVDQNIKSIEERNGEERPVKQGRIEDAFDEGQDCGTNDDDDDDDGDMRKIKFEYYFLLILSTIFFFLSVNIKCTIKLYTLKIFF